MTSTPGGVRQRLQHLGGGVDVVAGVGQQLAGGVRAVELVRHLLVAARRPAGAGSPGCGRRRWWPPTRRTTMPAAFTRPMPTIEAEAGGHRARVDLALLEAGDDDLVGDPPSAHDEATVATAKTAAPATASANGRGWRRTIARMARRPWRNSAWWWSLGRVTKAQG